MNRTMLLVDDESNILSVLTRVFRKEGYSILKAQSGKQGLELLEYNDVGVILSDQRMPEMTGVEFLSKVKERYPETIRIVLSGYTELNSVTDAINRGAIYKFLTKPWDDDLLRENIREAFDYYELRQKNILLAKQLHQANQELLELNKNLEQRVEEKTKELRLHVAALRVSQDVLEYLPMAVFGISQEGFVVFTNKVASSLCRGEHCGLVGATAKGALPSSLVEYLPSEDRERADYSAELEIDNSSYQLKSFPMGDDASTRGVVLVLTEVLTN